MALALGISVAQVDEFKTQMREVRVNRLRLRAAVACIRQPIHLYACSRNTYINGKIARNGQYNEEITCTAAEGADAHSRSLRHVIASINHDAQDRDYP